MRCCSQAAGETLEGGAQEAATGSEPGKDEPGGRGGAGTEGDSEGGAGAAAPAHSSPAPAPQDTEPSACGADGSQPDTGAAQPGGSAVAAAASSARVADDAGQQQGSPPAPSQPAAPATTAAATEEAGGEKSRPAPSFGASLAAKTGTSGFGSLAGALARMAARPLWSPRHSPSPCRHLLAVGQFTLCGDVKATVSEL